MMHTQPRILSHPMLTELPAVGHYLLLKALGMRLLQQRQPAAMQLRVCLWDICIQFLYNCDLHALRSPERLSGHTTMMTQHRERHQLMVLPRAEHRRP